MRESSENIQGGIEARRTGSRRASRLWLLWYPLAWMGLYALSSDYWFLPAGIRLATLLWMPRERWMTLALLEWLAILLVTLLRGGIGDPLVMLLGTLLPWGIYASVVRSLGAHASSTPTLESATRVLACGLTAALGNGVLLSAVVWLRHRSVHDVAQLLFRFALGDYIGVLLVLPLVWIVREHLLDRARPLGPLAARGWILAPAGVLLLFAWVPATPEARYPLLFSLPVLLWIAIHHGWRGTAVATALISVAIQSGRAALEAVWLPPQLQLVVAVFGTAALLLAVSADGLRGQGQSLASVLAMLDGRTQSLRDVASRLSREQELERTRLGVDLHDQLGQDMTAIATRLRLVERLDDSDAMRAELRQVQRLVDHAHSHLRKVINDLHPLELERFGLGRALAVGPIAEMLRNDGVDYRLTIDGEIGSLPMEFATALYRICQEAATNAVKHGCGGHLHIALTLETDAGGSDLGLRISDAAGAFAVEHRGRGLQSIQDRANALGGSYRFNAAAGEPRHWLWLRLPAPVPAGMPMARLRVDEA